MRDSGMVRHGLHMFCHFTVLYKLDGDVSQTRAFTDSSMLFTFSTITWFLIRELCRGVLVGLPHCCGFWRLFRPTFAENDNLITTDIVKTATV